VTPEFVRRLTNALWTVLTSLILSIIGVVTWAIYTTQSISVSIPEVYAKLNHLSYQIEEVKQAGERRDSEQERRNDQVDQLLSKHNLDISEALREHNAGIDASIGEMKATLDRHSEDLGDLKSFVQALKEQRQVIVVHHAEAEIPPTAPQLPPPIKAAEHFVSEILGTAPHHGSGRRPGQPRRTR
jgi:hypothetical protein